MLSRTFPGFGLIRFNIKPEGVSIKSLRSRFEGERSRRTSSKSKVVPGAAAAEPTPRGNDFIDWFSPAYTAGGTTPPPPS